MVSSPRSAKSMPTQPLEPSPAAMADCRRRRRRTAGSRYSHCQNAKLSMKTFCVRCGQGPSEAMTSSTASKPTDRPTIWSGTLATKPSSAHAARRKNSPTAGIRRRLGLLAAAFLAAHFAAAGLDDPVQRGLPAELGHDAVVPVVRDRSHRGDGAEQAAPVEAGSEHGVM